jgi:DNA-binding transcriptional MerR regulator
MRVEQLAAAADTSVDTIRYYQARGLLPAPTRKGRVAWYSQDHLDRLTRIRDLAGRGLTLATIGRLVRGELDAADEALAAAMSEAGGVPGASTSPSAAFGIDELARRSGIPTALLLAVAREGLLVARNGQYTDADVDAATAGLKLVEVGLPIPEVLELARRHDRAMREIAEDAVALFDTHVRRPLRQSDLAPDEAAERLVAAFQTLLPATTTIVTHHFQRMLLAVALEHMERVGDGPELAAVRDEQIRRERGA